MYLHHGLCSLIFVLCGMRGSACLDHYYFTRCSILLVLTPETPSCWLATQILTSIAHCRRGSTAFLMPINFKASNTTRASTTPHNTKPRPSLVLRLLQIPSDLRTNSRLATSNRLRSSIRLPAQTAISMVVHCLGPRSKEVLTMANERAVTTMKI